MTRPRPKLGTIAIAVCLVATPAAAAEFTHRPQANGPDIITISGEIEPDDEKKFIEIARNITQANVVLNSRGGYIAAAMRIGTFVRFREYETRVHNGAFCNSACTLIWLAGTFRHLDRYARLGFHSAATTRRPPYKRSDRSNALMAAYMTGLGVPQQVIDLQPKADPCCFNYIDHAQAKAWDLLSARPAKQLALPTPKVQRPAATAPALPKPMVVPPVTTSPKMVEKQFLSPLPSYPVPSPPAAAASSKPPVRGRWMIQVGTYPNEQAAKEQLSLVQSKASLMLTGHFVTSSAGAEAFIDSIEEGGTTFYRARFAGLDKDQAEWACEYLKLNYVGCIIIKSQEPTEPGTQPQATPATQQPAPGTIKTQERFEPGSQQAPATSAPAPGPEQRQDAQDDAACRKSGAKPGSIAYIACQQYYDDQRRSPFGERGH